MVLYSGIERRRSAAKTLRPALDRMMVQGARSERDPLDMADALVLALKACDPEGRVAEHCERVATRAGELAAQCGVDEWNSDALVRAARLHEIGRVALGVPPMLEARLPHVSVGAQIVRQTQGDLAGWLVEQQQTEHRDVLRIMPRGGTEVLLLGIMRVTDIADILAHPREEHGRRVDWEEFLRAGRGTRFHPTAVDAYLAQVH